MKTFITLTLTTVLLAVTAQAQTVNFDDAKPGEAPTGWTATKTGNGDAKWTVVADNSASSKPNVLKQSGETAGLHRVERCDDDVPMVHSRIGGGNCGDFSAKP